MKPLRAVLPKIGQAEVAMAACHVLVRAYERGAERGGSTKWEDVDDAHELAKKAVEMPPQTANDA